MKLRITKNDVEKYLQVSFHRSEEDFNRFIQEAYLFDLKPKVCPEFFQDFIKETPERDYELLLSGGEYTHNGKSIWFEGLKSVLSYFIYARYMAKSHQKDTPFGFAQKKTEDSEPLSGTERRDMEIQYKQMANELWPDVELFMKRHAIDFPEWNSCDGCDGPAITPKLKMSWI